MLTILGNGLRFTDTLQYAWFQLQKDDRTFYRAQVEHDLRAKVLRLRQKAAGVLDQNDLLGRLGGRSEMIPRFLAFFFNLEIDTHSDFIAHQYTICNYPAENLPARPSSKRSTSSASSISLARR